MKTAGKLLAVWGLGVITVIIIYPLLHETGHGIAAVLLGAKVTKLSLVPLPHVVCDMRMCDGFSFDVIGFSGMLLPFAMTEVYVPKRFRLWYVWFVVRGICLLSFVISLFAIAAFYSGHPVENEDITQVLLQNPGGTPIYFLILLILMVWGVVKVKRSKPMERCFAHFGLI